MRYWLRRALDVLGFSSPDRSLDTKTTLALGHLTVVLLLRVLILFGASMRYAVHVRRYLGDTRLLLTVGGVMGAYALYIAVLFWIRQRRPERFISEKLQFAELVLDVLFVSAMYYITGNNE